MLISYPFLPESGSAEDMEMLTVGQFPASMDGQWHGGIHLKAPTTEPVRAIADGTVVAYRLSQELVKEREEDTEGLMDNSFVLLRHETETDVVSIPGAAPIPVKVVFYSLYMHLMNVSTLTSQGRMNDLPACIQPSDGVVRGNGEKLYRKDIIGYPGQTYSTPGAIHFEIFATDDDFKRFFVDSANDPAGSRGVWGDAYFIIKKQAGDAKVRALSSLASIYPHALHTDPQAVDHKTMGGHTFEDGVEGDLDNDLFVRIRYDQGKKYTTTWINHGVDRPAELLTEETGEPDHDYEYAMYDIATALYPTCPSAGYELLRMGRILGPDSALLPQAEYKNYQLITYAEGKKGYIDLANDAVVRVLSDADFPYWMGWKKVDAGLVGSDGWVDMEALLRTLKLPVDEICGPLLPEQLARDYLQKHPHARDANRRLVCRFYNEWDKANNEVTYARLKEPDGLGAGINGPYLGDLEAFQAHMKFVEAMQWWSDAQEAVGDSNVWHFHPLGFIEHFGKCGWLSLDEMIGLMPKGSKTYHQMSNVLTVGQNVTHNGATMIIPPQMHPSINKTTRKYGLNSAVRRAQFWGQIVKESDHLQTVREYASGMAYDITVNPAKAHELGNAVAGDGPRYKGRGLIQFTGKANYIDYGKYRNFDMVTASNNARFEVDGYSASDSAGLYWVSEHTRDKLSNGNWHLDGFINISRRADKTHFSGWQDTVGIASSVSSVTRQINRAELGLNDRVNYFKHAYGALSDMDSSIIENIKN
jgi:predicted chitinase